MLRVLLAFICGGLWFGWYYITALGCGFGNGQVCGPFQGNFEMTLVMVWGPLGVICLIYLALWLFTRSRKS